MSDSSYIKLYRKFLDWEWWDDINTSRVFIFCLLKANWKDGKFQGTEVKRGAFISSISKISEGTNLSVREVRTALNHLKTTGEVTSKSTSKFTVFTVINYNQYQVSDTQDDKQATSKRQASDKQATTIEEYKEGKKETIDSGLSNDNPCQTETVRRVLEAWNALQDIGIKPVAKLATGTKRYESLVARIKQYGVDDVLSAIEKIRNSDFLQGKHSGKPWQITFDWFVLPNNFPKVFEGNYDNKPGTDGYKHTGDARLDRLYNRVREVDEWV